MSSHVTRIACVFHSVIEMKIPVSLTAHAMIIVLMDVMVVAMISVHNARNQRYEAFHGPADRPASGKFSNSFIFF